MAASLITNLFSTFLLAGLPFLAALIIISPFFPRHIIKIRRFAKGFNSLYLTYTAFFLAMINPKGTTTAFDAKLPFDLISSPGLTISFGLDGFSALMCVLVAFVTLLSLIMSKTLINSKHKFYYSLILLLESAAVGAFAANNPFTFFMFFELALIPVFFLISLWGGNSAKRSAVKFILFAGFGAILMLIATGLITAFCADTKISSNFAELVLRKDSIPLVLALAASIGFLAGFAPVIPIFPFHGALTDAKSEAPAPVCMALSSILPSIGVYGLVRINLQIFCTVFQILAPGLIFLTAVGVLWGALNALRQSGLKRQFAFLSNAGAGIILIGTLSFTEFGLDGAIIETVAFSLVFAGLYAGTGIIQTKFKTEKLALLGGAAKLMPGFAVFMLILTATVVSVPLTAGFFGNFLSITGCFNSPLAEKNYFLSDLIQTSAILGFLGILLMGAAILKTYNKIFFGICDTKFINEKSGVFKLSNHQTVVLFAVCAAIILFGLYPTGILEYVGTFTSVNIALILSSIF